MVKFLPPPTFNSLYPYLPTKHILHLPVKLNQAPSVFRLLQIIIRERGREENKTRLIYRQNRKKIAKSEHMELGKEMETTQASRYVCKRTVK